AVLSFSQAQNTAREWWRAEQRKAKGIAPDAGPYTVKQAIDDYLSARERHGSKGARKDRYAADARIVNELGQFEVATLTTQRIRDWHVRMASTPKLLRTKKTASKRATADFHPDDAETIRRRRSTANRLLTILKAALNHAFHEGHAASDNAWRKVKPF